MIRDFFDSDFLQEGILLTGKEPNRKGSPQHNRMGRAAKPRSLFLMRERQM
jgi:hypothetical protein